MAISNLLTLTIRKKTDYEPEVNTINPAYAKAAEYFADENQSDIDSVNLNGRILNIMGSLTDEQIAQVMKVGFKESVNEMIDIITTCNDISDQELINLFISKNKSGIPDKLRIIRVGDNNETQTINPSDAPKGLRIVNYEEPATNPSDAPESLRIVTPDPSIIHVPIDDNKGDDDNKGNDDNKSNLKTYVLKRKCTDGDESAVKENIYVDRKGSTFKLTNSVTGKEYTYTISSSSGRATIKSIEFMDNDRLLIVGDNLEIVAAENQNDNIILMGSNNYLDTNSGDDTVRVGLVQDSYNYFQEYWYYKGDGKLKEGYYYDVNNINNYINTGSGNDYVENAGGNYIDMGSGSNDYFYDYENYISQGYGGSAKNYEDTFKTGSSQTSDYKLEVASQGSYGDCKFLSFLNSFNGDLKDYVSFTKENNGYTVEFLKSGYSAFVSNDELDNSDVNNSTLEKLLYYENGASDWKYSSVKKNSTGDIDNILIEVAFRKLISDPSKNDGIRYNMDNEDDGTYYEDSDGQFYLYNGDENGKKIYDNADEHNNNEFGMSANNVLLSKFFYGTEGAGCYNIEQNNSYNWFIGLLNAYKNGEVTQLVVGTHDHTENKDAPELGIYANHAYAVKNFVEGQYVEITNPWDGKDTIRLDWDDFFYYFDSVNLFGDSFDEGNKIFEQMYSDPNAKPATDTGWEEDFVQKNTYTKFSSQTDDVTNEIDDITSNIEAVKAICYQKQKLELNC